MNSRDFYEKIALSLAGCQLVEQELKLYITEALLLAKKCVGSRMPFNMSGDDFQNAPLERLIRTFQKLCDNEGLADELSKFKDERNFLSHQAITSCLDFNTDLIDSEVAALEPRLAKIQAESDRLVHAIHDEFNKISVQLAFDPALGAEPLPSSE